MTEPFLNSGWENLFVVAIFFGILLLAFLRLDARLSASRRRLSHPLAFGLDKKGRQFFTDPDGCRWYPSARPK